jgi:hypothetical protein
VLWVPATDVKRGRQPETQIERGAWRVSDDSAPRFDWECPLYARPEEIARQIGFLLSDDCAPDGGSVFDKCVMNRGRTSMNMIVNPELPYVGEFACEEVYSFRRAQRAPATAPPEGATLRCSTLYDVEGESLSVSTRPEIFCTTGNTTRYALVDGYTGQWDDRANPPAWWPCEVTPPSEP